MNVESIYEAGRLIYLSLAYSSAKKRIVTQNSAEMTELLQRFQAEEPFRMTVDAGLRAMELRLLALEEGGLRLAARNADGFFAATLTDYGRLLARSDLKAADMLPVHFAIATALFPSEADLDMPVEDLGAIALEDVIAILRRFAHAEAAMPEEEEDRLHPQVRSVARRLRELPEDNPDRLRAGAGNSWVDLVERVLEHLLETGYLLRFEETPGDLEYRPTPAYQTSLREGIVYSFHAFRDILAAYEETESTDEPGERDDVSNL
ncbi:MAG: hypothetical protein WBG37_10920 [Desulfobacterales bacterium]